MPFSQSARIDRLFYDGSLQNCTTEYVLIRGGRVGCHALRFFLLGVSGKVQPYVSNLNFGG